MKGDITKVIVTAEDWEKGEENVFLDILNPSPNGCAVAVAAARTFDVPLDKVKIGCISAMIEGHEYYMVDAMALTQAFDLRRNFPLPHTVFFFEEA